MESVERYDCPGCGGSIEFTTDYGTLSPETDLEANGWTIRIETQGRHVGIPTAACAEFGDALTTDIRTRQVAVLQRISQTLETMLEENRQDRERRRGIEVRLAEPTPDAFSLPVASTWRPPPGEVGHLNNPEWWRRPWS